MTETHSQHGFDRLLEIWSRRKLAALLTFSAVLAIGVGVVMGLPNVYSASATLLVEPPPQAGGAREPGEVERQIQVMSEELLGRSRLAELVGRLRLYEGAGRRDRDSTDDRVERMRRDIKMELKKVDEAGSNGTPTTAFVLGYQGRDPATVALVANTLASDYLKKDASMHAGAVQSLAQQLNDMKKRLQEQEGRLGRFKEQHAGELPQQVETNMAALQRIDTRLQMVGEGRMRALERRAALAKEIGDASKGTQTASSDPDSDAGRLAKMKAQLADLEQRYSDKYPDVERTKAEIARLETRAAESKAARPAADPVAPLRDSLRETDSEVARLSREEEALRGEAAGYSRRIDASPRRGQAYEGLSRDYETTKTLYGTLLKSYEEAQLAAASDGSGARYLRLLESATVPVDPVAPNRQRLFVMVLVLALAAAGGAVLLLEQTDRSFHSVDDVRTFTRVPVLVSIPAMVSAGDARRRSLGRGFAVASALVSLVVVGALSFQVAHVNERLIALLVRSR